MPHPDFDTQSRIELRELFQNTLRIELELFEAKIQTIVRNEVGNTREVRGFSRQATPDCQGISPKHVSHREWSTEISATGFDPFKKRNSLDLGYSALSVGTSPRILVKSPRSPALGSSRAVLMLAPSEEKNQEIDQSGEDSEYTFQAFLQSDKFDRLMAILVFVNAVVLGLEADYAARHWQTDDVPFVFEASNFFMTGFFIIELLLKLYTYGLREYLFGNDWMWHWFQLAMTITQVTEECMKFSKLFFHISYPVLQRRLRLVRSLRVAMIFPLLDHMHATEELRLLVTSIAGSMKSLGCSIFVLFIFTYMFGVPLTQVVTDFKRTHPENEEAAEELGEYYGTLEKTMMALFQAISEGIHWRELMEPLVDHCSPYLALAFVGYILLTVFAMMNILTGIFVDSAMKTSANDKRGRIARGMRRLFEEADLDASGTLSHKEFEYMNLNNRDLRMYLKALEIEEDAAQNLFSLLDFNGDGELNSEEFVAGCLRFQGSAKAIDFASFMRDWRVAMVKINRTIGDIEKSMQSNRVIGQQNHDFLVQLARNK